MKVSWDDDIPNIWKKNVPNHQSVYYTNPLIHANVHVVYDINRIHKMVTPKIIQVIRPCES